MEPQRGVETGIVVHSCIHCPAMMGGILQATRGGGKGEKERVEEGGRRLKEEAHQ